MGIFDRFIGKGKDSKESNTLFGQTALGNNVVYQGNNKNATVNTQILYVTTASSTNAGRPVDTSMLTRNSTVMSCVAVKARAMSQLPINIMALAEDGTYVNALTDSSVGVRDKIKAKQVYSLLTNPNNFQSAYEYWYQWMMWHELLGEAFTLWWRKDQADPTQLSLIHI
jgi:phage portal protein BeeE